MKKIFFVWALCAACCDFTDEYHYYVDPRLKSSVDVFMSEAVLHHVPVETRNLLVVIGEINSTGLCEKFKYGATITINSKLFTVDSLALNYVVFHEFGHYMGRGHNNSFSIMNPNTYAGEFHNDSTKRRQLIDELFSSL